jgi:hypothetical protein
MRPMWTEGCGIRHFRAAGQRGPGPIAAAVSPPHDPPLPVTGWGTATMILLGGVVVGHASLLILRLMESTALVDGIAWPTSVAMVGAAVSFLVWFYRLRRNAGRWGPQRRRPGWAIWGWFVPGPFLWFPFQIAQDALRATAPAATLARRNALLAGWWAAWVLAWLTGIRYRTYLGPTRGGTVVPTTKIEIYLGSTIASSILTVVAAGLAAVVVWQLTDLQTARLARPTQPAVQLPAER